MNKLLTALAIVVGIVAGIAVAHQLSRQAAPIGGGSVPFSFISSTQATPTMNPYTWSTVLSAESAKGYVAICNDSIVSNDAVYLGFGATSTKPYGYRLGSGQCYQMTGDNLFYGTLYGIASTATATVLTVKANYY